MRRQALIVAALAVLLPVVAQAAINVAVESKVITPNVGAPTEGYVDVFIETTGTNPLVGGFQAVITSTGAAGKLNFVTPFAKVTTDTNPPGGSTQVSRPQLISSNFLANVGGDNNESRASSTAFTPSGGVDALNGSGLMRVPFVIPAGAVGQIPILVDLTPFAGTNFADADGNAMPVTATPGLVTIVPEPASLSLLGVAGLLFLRRRRAA